MCVCVHILDVYVCVGVGVFMEVSRASCVAVRYLTPIWVIYYSYPTFVLLV